MINYFDTFSLDELEINEWYREYFILLLTFTTHCGLEWPTYVLFGGIGYLKS